MVVYIVIDNINSCYDHGNQFHSVHGTLEEAREAISDYDEQDRLYFDIEEHVINLK